MPPRKRRSGFTLVEIMVVVMIIGVLAALAIAAFAKARQNTQNTCFINDLRVACDAFELYVMENKSFPPDGMPGVVPVGMATPLSHVAWAGVTPLGGQWDWDYMQFGFKAGVSIYLGAAMNDARMIEIDRKIDDGDMNAGRFRRRSQGYIYIIEF